MTLEFRVSAIPILAGAADAWHAGARPGGGTRNLDYVQPLVAWASATDVERALLTDPQTSGGLLVAVPSKRVGEYLQRVPRAVEIGEVLPRGEATIVLG